MSATVSMFAWSMKPGDVIHAGSVSKTVDRVDINQEWQVVRVYLTDGYSFSEGLGCEGMMFQVERP